MVASEIVWSNLSVAGAFLLGFVFAAVVMVRLFRAAKRETNRRDRDNGA